MKPALPCIPTINGASSSIQFAMVEELRRLSPFNPKHLPEEILLTEAFHRRFPDLPQVPCFDTAFHHDLPRVARLLPIPRRYEAPVSYTHLRAHET